MQSSSPSPSPSSAPIDFAFPAPPEAGRTIEVAPGILWARLALPFLLDHVNIYFVDDGDGVDHIPGSFAHFLAVLLPPTVNQDLFRQLCPHGL